MKLAKPDRIFLRRQGILTVEGDADLNYWIDIAGIRIPVDMDEWDECLQFSENEVSLTLEIFNWEESPGRFS